MAKRTVEWESKGADKVVSDTKKIRAEEKRLAKEQKAAEKEAQDRAKATGARLERTRNAYLAVAAGIGVVVGKLADSLVAYAKADATAGRLRRTLEQTADTADRVESAFARANATFRDWERYGVTAEEQTAAFDDLVQATGNYEQSMQDVSLALDIAAAKNIDFERAAESVRKVRQGEVEILKELGVLTKNEAEDLGRVKNEAHRTREAITKLSQAFAGGAEGTDGLDTTLKATHAKLERTEQLMGKISAALVEDGTGLIASMGEFVGILDEGEHPLDNLNDRLETLANHAENGDWEKLAGVLLLGNPATFVAGMSLLGIASNGGDAVGGATPPKGAIPQGQSVDEVPEPVPGNMGGRPKGKDKPRGRRDPNAGSDAITGADAATDAEIWQAIWEEAYGRDIEAKEAAEQAKRDALNETVDRETEARAYLDDLVRETAKLKREAADQEKKDAEEIAAEKAKAHKMVQDSAFAAAEGAAGLASMFIEDEGAKAVIEGGLQVAYAIAAGATGNVPGAIAHGAAAAQFFAVAAQAGAGGAGSKGAGGGAGAAAAAQARTPEQRESTNASAFGAGVGSRGGLSGINVEVNLNSIAKPTPQEQRVIGQSVADEVRLIVGGG